MDSAEDIRIVVADEIRGVWPSYPANELEVVQVAAESMGATPADVREAVERVRQDEGAWGAPPYASKFRNRLVELTGTRPKRKPARAPQIPKGFVLEEQEDGRILRVEKQDGNGEPLNFGALRDRYPFAAMEDHELEPYYDEFPGLRPLGNGKERLTALLAFLRGGTEIPERLG